VKVGQMKRASTSIGGVKVIFETRSNPCVHEDIIRLPNGKTSEFFRLNKTNFIFLFRNRFNDTYWFGGKDENHPFITQITPAAFLVYSLEGTEVFYKYLVPEFIRDLEETLGVKHERQGDIIMLGLGVTWKKLFALEHLGLLKFSIEPRKDGIYPVFRTRHSLRGKCFSFREIPGRIFDAMLVEGTLSAPNHKSVKLKGVHVLTQIVGLASSSGD
jgi:hypothetical protein